MKARVQTGTVLICCFEKEAADRLTEFFSAHRVSVRYAGPEDLGRQLSALLGLPGDISPAEQTADAVITQALIFSAFSNHALNRILDELNRDGLARGALRAILTPHNRSWTLGKLLGELETERKAMQAGRQPVKEDSADD